MVTVDAAGMALVQALSPLLIALLGGPLLGERLLGVMARHLPRALFAAGRGALRRPRATSSSPAILLGCLGVLGLAGGTLYFGRLGRGVPLLPATAVRLGSAAVLWCSRSAFETPHALVGRGRASVAWTSPLSIGSMVLYYLC